MVKIKRIDKAKMNNICMESSCNNKKIVTLGDILLCQKHFSDLTEGKMCLWIKR